MRSVHDSTEATRAALVLTGGGARAAYQAGALLAIARINRPRRRNPFPIICGTSAGAINAVGLACQAEHFGRACRTLADFWRRLEAGHVYRADPLGVGVAGARWLSMLALGWLTGHPPRSLLDNNPLRQLLKNRVDFAGINRAIANGALHAVSVAASGYDSGDNISFFQAPDSVPGWRRVQRIGLRTELEVEHLLASSALPFIFPATHIHREYFGDGSMRQTAPLSPAIHLGAGRILIIGTGRPRQNNIRQHGDSYPSLAQIAGHALASIFVDGLAIDIERTEHINQLLTALPEESRHLPGNGLRQIRTLDLSPSQPIESLAARHAQGLPWPMRLLLGGIGGMNPNSGTLLSYLLFEKGFIAELIELGYHDTLSRGEDIGNFLDL